LLIVFLSNTLKAFKTQSCISAFPAESFGLKTPEVSGFYPGPGPPVRAAAHAKILPENLRIATGKFVFSRLPRILLKKPRTEDRGLPVPGPAELL